jgi:hypothetical protein
MSHDHDAVGDAPEGTPDFRPVEPRTTYDQAWDKAAADTLVGQLSSVRGTAEKWAGTVTALVGVFSTVAVVTGADALEDLSQQTRIVVVALIVLAGLAALASIWKSAAAAQGSFTRLTNWNGDSFRDASNTKIGQAITDLNRSRVAGVVAAALVFVVSVISLVAGAAPTASSPTNVLVIDDGVLRCGALGTVDGIASVAGTPVTAASQVTVVSGC